jgi:hypothetical protein
MVCICSLRTQQRAKSQCIKHIPPSVGWLPLLGVSSSTDLYVKIAELIWSFGAWLVRHSRVFTVRCVAVFRDGRRLYIKHSTESLILAQDERWRRA